MHVTAWISTQSNDLKMSQNQESSDQNAGSRPSENMDTFFCLGSLATSAGFCRVPRGPDGPAVSFHFL